ncbi:class I adenylate-forming enzyme family protein [Nocardioides sp. MAHUQ-72]|uniref:class I adenylate-forming enzyme family protein n=1 Tax=unclassified Nocardioides TaxID=2615069 RepID=UPI00360A968B
MTAPSLDLEQTASHDMPEARTASALIRELAHAHPHRVAETFEGRHRTFAGLDADVTTWAKALMAAGVQRGQAVSILAGNHPNFVTLAFATARVGAFLAPLNTWHTAPELQYTAGHAPSVLLFTIDTLRKQDFRAAWGQVIPELTAQPAQPHWRLNAAQLPALLDVISLDGGLPGATSLEAFLAAGASVTDEDLAAREALNRPEDLMYLLFTSGSTSKPKAVKLHQGHLIENAWWIGDRQGITPDDRAWIATPLFYGVSAMQGLFGALTHGARIVLQEAFEPTEAVKLLEEQQCTVYYGFGNLTRKLLAVPGFDKIRIALRKGMIGFSVEDRRLALDELGVINGCSVYGMTETYGLFALTRHDDPRETVLTSQGFPLPGNELRIVDPATGAPLPAGQVGDLQLRGRITSGYFDDEERTRASFTDDGFFRTGDQACVDDTGRLVYHSRAVDTMKPGGINVAPQEVEALLDEVPGIAQAHVCAIPDPADGERVVAFIEADPAVTTPEFIVNHLRGRAASYKIPRHFIYRSDADLPKLPSGKIPRPMLVHEAQVELAPAHEARPQG